MSSELSFESDPNALAFGDRMKLYEGHEADRSLIPLLPAIARLDGKAFHTFTRGLARPYDQRLSDLMVATTRYLVQETNACMGYTQSDEISLAWLSTEFKSQIFFNGRIHKMVSVLASLCTAYFNELLPSTFGVDVKGPALFDCRVFNVPNPTEGANVFLWREQDATRNSISMAAQAYYSHTQLHNKNTKEMQEMLFQKGVNWNDYPVFFKRGTFVQRRVRSRRFTVAELEKLPSKHEARKNPELMVERTDYEVIPMPPFGKVINRPGVIFQGEDPQVEGL